MRKKPLPGDWERPQVCHRARCQLRYMSKLEREFAREEREEQ